MNKNTLVIVGLIVVAVIVGGLLWSMKQKETNAAMEKEKMMMEDKQKGEMMKNDAEITPETGEMMKKDGEVMPTGDAMMKDDKQTMMKSENYIAYTTASLAKASENGGKPVIFFKASWCPTCQAADVAFKANLDKIPPGVTILKADYDTEKDLKAKYGITYQHTFVQVDSNGKELAKWNGGDIDNLVSNIK